jgi:hypothetical protein
VTEWRKNEYNQKNPAYYVLFAILKAMFLVMVVWLAWKWPKKET